MCCSPKTAKELFNLHHSQARNIVEHLIGVLKGQFSILRTSSFRPMPTQARIIPALCAIHNFIRQRDPQDMLDDHEFEDDGAAEPRGGESELQSHSISRTEVTAANERRDQMSTDMWENYQVYLVSRST
jgi:hypothetical protein